MTTKHDQQKVINKTGYMVGNENTKTKRQKTWRNLPIHTKYKHQYEHRHLIKTILTDNAPISDYKRRWMEML